MLVCVFDSFVKYVNVSKFVGHVIFVEFHWFLFFGGGGEGVALRGKGAAAAAWAYVTGPAAAAWAYVTGPAADLASQRLCASG